MSRAGEDVCDSCGEPIEEGFVVRCREKAESPVAPGLMVWQHFVYCEGCYQP